MQKAATEARTTRSMVSEKEERGLYCGELGLGGRKTERIIEQMAAMVTRASSRPRWDEDGEARAVGVGDGTGGMLKVFQGSAGIDCRGRG